MKRFLLARPVGNGMRGILLLAMLLMSLGYGGTDVAYAAPPTHDDFDSAKTILGIEYHDSVDTTEATPIEGAPNDDPDNIPCEGDTLNAGFASVWYKYTPPETQSLSLNTYGSSYDTFIAVWTGSRGSLNPVDCNDQTFEDQSELSFVATGGTTYYIEIAQYNDGVPGGFISGNLVFNAYITNTTVKIGATHETSYYVPETTTLRRNLINLNAGPVEIFNVAQNQIMVSERFIIKNKPTGVNTGFSEMMGLPNNQLYNAYRLPWYTNNQTMNTQLRIANVSASTATIRIWIGGLLMPGNPFTLASGETVFKSYPGVNRGPVRIASNVNIVASERVIYQVNGLNASSYELMALPENRLSKVYWLPWYNNKAMNTQLQISNVSASPATIRVFIGGKPMGSFTLAKGKTKRLTYPGVDRGPVKVTSNVNILVSERVTYKFNTVPVSFTEVMGLPSSQLDTTYWMPLYTQNSAIVSLLQIANTSTSPATVHVHINGVEMTGSPFRLAVGAGRRVGFAIVEKGPVKITSNVKIVASMRVIYKVNSKPTSYSEMLALPNKLLDSKYWMPWYNNAGMNTQLRFGLP